MSKRIHSLEGREERVHELGNAAHGKQELTCWRGGRGRGGLVSSEMWHVANKVPPCGREREDDPIQVRKDTGSKAKTTPPDRGEQRRRLYYLGGMPSSK